MAITPLPTAPSRADPTNFSTRADAFMTALPTFATECNATAVAMTLNATNSTSTTSLVIGLGSKSLTVQTAKSYVVGMTVKIASTASPTNWMIGDVTAYTTGTGALVVNVLYSGGSGTIASWNVMQSVATTGNATLTSINGGQLAGLRNRIINGDMRVAQRGTSFGNPTIAIETYTTDRWLTYATGAAVIVLRSSGPNAVLPYALSQVGVAGNTGCSFYQRVESLNSMSLSGQNVTISAWLYSTDAISVTWNVYSFNVVDVSTAKTSRHTGTIALSAGWNYTTLNIPAFDTVAASNGFQFGYAFPATLAGITRAGTGVQLEIGGVATLFEQRPYGLELALCQRYYERSSAIVNQVAASAQHLANVWFKVAKRVNPTSIVYTSSVGGATGKGYNYSTSLDIAATTQGAGTDMITVALQTTVSAGNNIAFNYTAEAEL